MLGQHLSRLLRGTVVEARGADEAEARAKVRAAYAHCWPSSDHRRVRLIGRVGRGVWAYEVG